MLGLRDEVKVGDFVYLNLKSEDFPAMVQALSLNGELIVTLFQWPVGNRNFLMSRELVPVWRHSCIAKIEPAVICEERVGSPQEKSFNQVQFPKLAKCVKNRNILKSGSRHRRTSKT